MLNSIISLFWPVVAVVGGYFVLKDTLKKILRETVVHELGKKIDETEISLWRHTESEIEELKKETIKEMRSLARDITNEMQNLHPEPDVPEEDHRLRTRF